MLFSTDQVSPLGLKHCYYDVKTEEPALSQIHFAAEEETVCIQIMCKPENTYG